MSFSILNRYEKYPLTLNKSNPNQIHSSLKVLKTQKFYTDETPIQIM